MRPSSSSSKRAVLSQNSTRPSHRRRRRLRFELQLERLEDRQLLSGSTSSSPVLFHDTFSSNTPSSAWSFVGGKWQINNGVLSQTSTAAADPKKAMITNQTYPSNLIVTSEVQVNSWNAGDMARAGIGLYTNTSNGNGYNLVFHGTNQVQFLNDHVTWGNAYTFKWQVGTWYWFQLEENNGTLEGKVWAAGTAEPQNWMFQQTGWTNLTGGAPALNGGSADGAAGDGSSTVSFASVSVTTTNVQPDTANAGSAFTTETGSAVTFSQATATGTDPLTYAWNFGDGGTATGALNPTYTYQSAGTYNAQLTVTDALGIPATSTVTVTVNNSGSSTVNNSGSSAPTVTVSNATQAGMTYYVSPSATSGSGTLANPFGLPDLLNADDSPGRALKVLQPGDTLDFEAGNYHFNGVTNSSSWSIQLLGPTVSGTPTQPITLQAMPGATVNIFEDSGSQPVFGTGTPALNYVRFLGFNVTPGGDAAFYIAGVGDEVAYNNIVGEYVATADNHDGIRIETANAAWIHNNIITGVTGESHNSAGIKVYQSTNLLITDNYIYGNTTGIFDKDSGTLGDGTNLNTYARNWITNNTGDQFLGNNQGDLATYYIYDNVINGGINLYTINTGSQIYNNLLFTTGVFSWEECYLSSIWNNIILTGSQPGSGYSTDESLSTGQSTSPVAYMDYNVYDNAPEYSFSGHYTLAQMQSYGFENHAYVSSDSSLFQNTTSYVLLPQWTTAGRYGDPVGPRYPVAQIMNTSRYGPGAR